MVNLANLQREIRLIKESFESIPSVTTDDLDEVIDHFDNEGYEPTLLRAKIFKIIENYMRENANYLPSDLYILKTLVKARKGWGYATKEIVYDKISTSDNIVKYAKKISKLTYIKVHNMRFMTYYELKNAILAEIIHERIMREEELDVNLSIQRLKPYHENYRKEIIQVRKQLEELKVIRKSLILPA